MVSVSRGIEGYRPLKFWYWDLKGSLIVHQSAVRVDEEGLLYEYSKKQHVHFPMVFSIVFSK